MRPHDDERFKAKIDLLTLLQRSYEHDNEFGKANLIESIRNDLLRQAGL